MSFKEVQSLDAETAIALGGYNKKNKKDNQTTITGYFLGSKIVDSPKSTSGKSKLHIFQTPNGNVGVWGKTDLDSKLNNAPIGAMVRASFVDVVELKGGNTMYKYKVEVDTSNSITVVASAIVPDESDDSLDTDDTDSLPDVAPPKTTSAAKQSSIKELLANGRVRA